MATTTVHRDPAEQIPLLKPLRAAVPVLMLSVATVLVLGIHVAGAQSSTRVDTYITSHLAGSAAGSYHLLRTVTELANPALVVATSLLLGIWCTLLGLWRAALLAVSAPALALLATDLWLKPLIGRQPVPGAGDSFPSGHATTTTAMAAVLLLLLLPRGPLHSRLPRPVVALLVSGAIVFPLCVGVALVGLGYHDASDVIGGAAVAVAVVVALATQIDVVARMARERALDRSA